MNCCDDYGVCNQSYNCPCRTEVIDTKRSDRIVLWLSEAGISILLMLGTSAATASVIGWGIFQLINS